jgi:hypothetical protein
MTARDIFYLAIPLVRCWFWVSSSRASSNAPKDLRFSGLYRNHWKLLHKRIVVPRPALWLLWAGPGLFPKSSTKSEIDRFLEAAAKLPAASWSGRGRLIFALDAMMSRQATWEIAQSVQGRMFATAAAYGGIGRGRLCRGRAPSARIRGAFSGRGGGGSSFVANALNGRPNGRHGMIIYLLGGV